MSELTELGYPEGYHMGLSAILWWITIGIVIILGIILYLNARKSDLINVKQMLYSKSFGYLCYVIFISLIQVGVLYPDNFLLFYQIGGFLFLTSSAIYFYYWEKYLTSIKHIPTISMGAASVISLSSLFITILFPELVVILLDILVFIILILFSIAFLIYSYLIFKFSRNVKGVNKYAAWIWILGVIQGLIAGFFENPPGVKIVPLFFVLFIIPILYTVFLITAVYGILTLFGQISSYYAQTQKCAVHRGVIDKGTTIYYCPSCGITYCELCFNQVIINDGCWNCRHGIEVEMEKEWKTEQSVEVKKDAKSKHKSPKKSRKL